MTEIIGIVSGKGGVGKTFISINLAAALARYGKKTLLVDANLTTPNVVVNLKIPEWNKTLHDVLRGEVNIKDAIVNTDFGFDLVPSSLSIKDLFDTEPENLPSTLYDVMGLYDYIILDTSAGLGRESLYAIKSSEKLFIIVNPEKASVVDAYKVIKLAETLLIPIQGIIINKYRKNGLKAHEIERILGYPIFGIIHEDKTVTESLEKGIPLIYYRSDSIASYDIDVIARKLLGLEEPKKKEQSLLDKILNLIKWR